MVSMFGAEGDLWKWKRGEKKKSTSVVDFSLETNCSVQLWGGTGDSTDPQCAEASLGVSH